MSWHNEPYRHSLASRGIKTGRKNMTNTEYKKLYPKSHWNLDSDNDGVKNKDDCFPFDPMRQGHLNQTTMNRLRELPIYVTDDMFVVVTDSLGNEKIIKPDSYQLMSKDAKKYAPKARAEFLSAVHKYPTILGDIERTEPEMITYTSNINYAFPSGLYSPSSEGIYLQGRDGPFTLAQTTHHELRHDVQNDEFGQVGMKHFHHKDPEINPMERDAMDYSRAVMSQYGEPMGVVPGYREDYPEEFKEFGKKYNRYSSSEKMRKIAEERTEKKRELKRLLKDDPHSGKIHELRRQLDKPELLEQDYIEKKDEFSVIRGWNPSTFKSKSKVSKNETRKEENWK